VVDWGIACLLAATAGPKSVARTMDAANCAAVLLSMPISHHFLRLYSATGRARRRKWRYIKYTPLPFTFLNYTICFSATNVLYCFKSKREITSGTCDEMKLNL